VSGGNVSITQYLGLQMRKKAIIYEGMIDTIGKLARNLFKKDTS
jgi:hypothetical protein